MATDEIEIRTGTKDATSRGQRPHKVSASRAGPTPYTYYTYMGHNTTNADLRPARVLALSQFFLLVSPPLGVANYDLGKNAQPRRGGRKTKLGRANGVTTGTRQTLQSRHPVPTSSYSHPAVQTTVQRSYQRGVRLQAVGPTRRGLKGWVRIRMPFWLG